MVALVEIENLFKIFQVGTQKIEVLRGINLTIPKGDFVIITGPSGCGKSTLLHTIIGLEVPTKGKVRILGHELYAENSEDARSEILANVIGMIYQQPNWIKSLNVLENVAFPLMLHGMENEQALGKAASLLKEVGLSEWAKFKPYNLSSGQQQKTALARALIIDPEMIIADEPTGNLDVESGEELMEILKKLNQNSNKTILMVTHNTEYLKYAKHAFKMLNGQIEAGSKHFRKK